MFPLWYVRHYPVALMRTGALGSLPVREARPALLENIRTHGLANPVIVLNHRDPECWEHHWVSVGSSRVAAIRELRWQFAPAMVTGDVSDLPPGAAEAVDWEDVNELFTDGEVYLNGQGWPKLRGYRDFTKGEFPDDTSIRGGRGPYFGAPAGGQHARRRQSVGLNVPDFRDLDI